MTYRGWFPPTEATLGPVLPEAPFNYSYNLMFPTLALTGSLEISRELFTSDVFPFLLYRCSSFSLSPPAAFWSYLDGLCLRDTRGTPIHAQLTLIPDPLDS